jgi:hypothetical protein
LGFRQSSFRHITRVSQRIASKTLVNKGFRDRRARRLSTIVPVCGVAG